MFPVPLPTSRDADWPPKAQLPFIADVLEADAWWSGDPKKLAAFYTGTAEQPRPTMRDRLWGRTPPTGTKDTRLHVPIASDLAQTGADLLFSEDAAWTIPAAHQDQADTEVKAAQDALAQLSDDLDLGALLLEAAEIAGGLGGVYLRPTWDETISTRHPLVHVITPDRAVPTWTGGYLTAVTFWSELRTEATDKGRVVWRHLECHEPGLITHGLYVGSADKLGQRLNLDRHPATRGLDDEINLVTEIGWDRLLPVYVPNVRPNRKHRGSPLGRADTAGSESMMDALDETMTSWQRDIRIGKARIIVANDFLDRAGPGNGATFDADREVFSPLDIDPSVADKAGITPVEFEIRCDEHAATAADLTDRIIRGAGYSPRSLGIADGGQKTATEVTADTTLSARTNSRKQRYWGAALGNLSEALLAIAKAKFGSAATPMRATVDFADIGAMDIRDMASALNLINLAKAASIQTRVRMLQPELEGQDLEDEVQRIKDEEGVTVADPTGGFT